MPPYKLSPQDQANVDRANAMLAQTQAQGSTPFAGSSFATPAPVAPTAPVAPQLTSNAVYSGLGDSQELISARNTQAERDRVASAQSINEDDIRSQTLASFQAEIDAQNSIYADKLKQAKVTGAGRIGSSTAIQARRGLLGSDFGGAITDETNTANQDIYTSIENEKQARISDIRSKSRTESTAIIAERRKAKEEGLDAYIKHLSESGTRKVTNAQKAAALLLSQGVKVEDLSKEQLDDLTKSHEISIDDLKNAYKPLAEQQAQADKKAKQDEEKRVLDLSKTTADIEKTKIDTAQISKKFEEDKRQFGLEYAIKLRNASVQEREAKVKEIAEAMKNPTNVVLTPEGKQKALSQIALVRRSIKNANTLSAESGSNTAWEFVKQRFVNTDYQNLQAEANTIRVNVLTMMTDPSIKKFFGPQMSNADVQLMTAAGTTLNPELQSPEQLMDELVRLNDLIDRAETAVNKGEGTGQVSQTGGNTSTADELLSKYGL